MIELYEAAARAAAYVPDNAPRGVPVGPPKRDRGVFQARSYQPSREEKPAPTRFSDDGDRVYDPVTGCDILVIDKSLGVSVRAPGASAIPEKADLGVLWEVRETTGQPLWRYRARGWNEALAEKRRLCQAAGGRSGFAYLVVVG
jgi:hypothetical protein